MELSAAFFDEHVAPLADRRLDAANYAAALVGGGSEVLGLDDEVSTDHDWGPRVTMFVEPAAQRDAASIGAELPTSFRGVSTRFGSRADGPPRVRPFEVTTVEAYFDAWIGFHGSDQATVLDWLATPSMSFLAVTAGAVFRDGVGQLTDARQSADWYPDDVWRWLIACQWRRIGEEQPFIARAARSGDTLGAAVIAARVVRDGMRLAFLLERRYAPYSKWTARAFATLDIGADLASTFEVALDARTPDGPDALCEALEVLGSVTNERLGLDVDPSRVQYFGRPMQVAPATDFTEAALGTVTDPHLRSVATNIGNVDMLFGTNNGGFPGARAAYEAILGRDARVT
jgi:hypothetical protein